MSKKNFARRTVAIIAILMLSLAPVSLADDGSIPAFSFINNILESITDSIENVIDTLDAALGGDETTTTTSEPPEENSEEDDEGLPDFGPNIDPIG